MNDVWNGAIRVELLSASPMTPHIMGVTATPKPQISISIRRVAVNMNPISFAVVGCQCSWLKQFDMSTLNIHMLRNSRPFARRYFPHSFMTSRKLGKMTAVL